MIEPFDRDLVTDYEDFRRRMVSGVRFSRLVFAVMHGNGNVILVLDEALSGLRKERVDAVLAREICRSFRAVRVDGIAFVRVTGGRVRMTYFERDGTRSRMCGNALRCVTRYGMERGYLCASGDDIVETDDGDKWVSSVRGEVRVALGPDREFQRIADGRYFVFSGLPHLVLLVPDLSAVDVVGTGRPLRHDAALCERLRHPEGLHVDFMQRLGDGIGVRTYEVGVEDETEACGTGVAGSAAVAHRVWDLPYPIRVRVRGGEMTVDQGRHGLMIGGELGYLFATAGRRVTRRGRSPIGMPIECS